ncbi:MAG: hypothetical protein WA417_07060 [Stellaceae bacterium]
MSGSRKPASAADVLVGFHPEDRNGGERLVGRAGVAAAPETNRQIGKEPRTMSVRNRFAGIKREQAICRGRQRSVRARMMGASEDRTPHLAISDLAQFNL